MSKDSNSQGLSRILKLSLDAAFSTTASPHAVSVQAHGECEARVDQGSGCTTDHVNTTSRLQVEDGHVVNEEDLKNTVRHPCAGKFSKRSACRSGRGRGRKLAEKCSKPGSLLQNDECVASNICENQPDDVRLQITSDASLGIAKMADGSAAGKNVAEKQCVDIVSLTSIDKPKLTKEEEDTCELPDLVKCQTSTERINSMPKNKELKTGRGKQDHSSNSSSLDCPAFSDKTKTVEHLLLSKSLTPERNIYSRGKYPHGTQKQNREAAALLVAPWREKAAPDYADFFMGKRTGQQSRAYGRNYYTKKELFCSASSEKHKLNRSLNCLKQPVFQNRGGTCRDDDQFWRNKFTNKQSQDIRICGSNKDTFKTPPHKLKEDRGRGTKEQDGDTSKGKHLMEDARKAKQEVNVRKTNQQKACGSTSKQHETDEGKSKQHNANDREINQQKADGSKVNQQKADYNKANQQKADDSKVNQPKADDSKTNQPKADDSKTNQQKADDSKTNQQKADDSKTNQQKADDSKTNQQKADDSKTNQQKADDNKANQKKADDSKVNQLEADDSKTNQQKADDSKVNQPKADDSKTNQQKADDSKTKQQKADDGKANQQKADDSKANQQKVDGSKANQQKADAGRSKQEINESKSTQSETKASHSKHEVYDRNPKQQGAHNSKAKHDIYDRNPKQQAAHNNKAKHEVDAIKSKQQQFDSKHELLARHNEADQQGDDSKTRQCEGDGSKVSKQKGDQIKSNKQEADSKPQKVIKVNDIRNYFTAKPSINVRSKIKNVDNLDSVSRYGERQNHQLVQETSVTRTAEAAANSLYQDASEMTSLHNKEHTSFQNKVNVSTENTDNSVVLKTSIANGTACMQEPIKEASSGFVGSNSSVHTMISAIYRSYEEATVQHDGKPAELSSNVEMQGSTDAEYVPGDASEHAQEESTLKYIISSAEKDLTAMDDFSTKEKREGYMSASVQKGGDNECVYVKNREVMKTASEEEIGDIMCACQEGRENGLSVSEQKEAIVCEVSTYRAKEKREGNNYISEEKGELHVCTSREKGDVISALEQKGEVGISVYEQKEEVGISASKVRGDTLRNYKDMLVNNMNYETLKINQDLENDLHPASIASQEISLPPCHMSDSSSKLYAYFPTTVESEHSRLCETVLSQNPPEESSADHYTTRAPKDLLSQQIMVGQQGHSRSNVPDTSHQRIPYYECSTYPGSYLCSASSLNTSEGKRKNSSFAPFFHTRELSLPAEALGSEAAMDRIMTFLRSCSTSIDQHMNQYHDNHHLDVTITVSLKHPPLPDYIPRLLHHPGNPCLEDRSMPHYPLPVCPYPGWMPAHPSYWSWQPWVERYSPSLGAPFSSARPYYTCSPSTIQPVSSADSGPLSADASNRTQSESDENSHGPASDRAHADRLGPKMYSCLNPAVFDGQQELGRAHILTVDRWRGCSTPEMDASNLHVDASVVEDYSMSRLHTSKDVAVEETWNDECSTASSRHLTETVSLLNLPENHYLLGNLRTENVALSSRSSKEPVMQDADGRSHFRQNSVRNDSLRKPVTNNWTSRMTPPVANNFRNENVGASPRPAASTPSPDSLFLRDATGPVVNRASNLTCRPRRFQPAPRFTSQAARRRSAPYHMTKPWTVHQPQSRRRKSFPLGANISSENRGNTGENGQLESEAGSSSPSNVAANKKCVGDWAVAFVARSRNYNYRFIDCHCHIDFLYSKMEVPRETYFSKFQEQNAETFPGNYEGCVAVFCHPSTFIADNPEDDILKTVSMEGGVWLALGCHPKHAVEFTDSHLRGLRHMLKHPKVVALGEIGLDYSGTFHKHSEVQKLVFRQQLQLAIEMKLPIVIHCRDADDDCLEILTEMMPSDHKIHAHCFTRDINVAMRWMIPFQNLFLGLTPVITYKTALDAVSTATFIPLDRLLLETDAPFFVPAGVRKRDARCSHPGFALFTAERVAELKRIPVDEVLKACRENTQKMYGI